MEMKGQLCALVPSPLVGSPWYLLSRLWTRQPVGTLQKRKYLLPLARIEPKFLGHPPYNLVTVVTTLSFTILMVDKLHIILFLSVNFKYFGPCLYVSLRLATAVRKNKIQCILCHQIENFIFSVSSIFRISVFNVRY